MVEGRLGEKTSRIGRIRLVISHGWLSKANKTIIRLVSVNSARQAMALRLVAINGRGERLSPSSQTWAHREVKLLPLVQPDLGHSRRILQNDIRHSAREGVRALVAEHVTDVRARRDLENAAALPNLIQSTRQLEREKLRFALFIARRRSEKNLIKSIYLHESSFRGSRRLKSNGMSGVRALIDSIRSPQMSMPSSYEPIS